MIRRRPTRFIVACGTVCALIGAHTADGDPVVGPQARVDVGGGTAPANETTIASTDFNPQEIVAAWNDYRVSGTVRLGVALSLDGGQSWTDFLLRPPPGNRVAIEGDPMTAYDHRTGTLWVGAIAFTETNGGVYVARKNPGSPTFEPPVMANVTGGADKGWMAAGGDPNNANLTRLYIAYNQGLLISTDMGDTWSGPFFLDSGLGFLPRVGPGGELYIVYWDGWDGVLLLRSFDGGSTFGSPIQVATRMDVWGVDGSRFAGTFRVPPLAYLAVDPTSGTLYCTYFDTTDIVAGSSNVDLYFCKSVNQGSSWTTPAVINGDSTPPGDQFFPWMEVDKNGRIHLLFYDTRQLSHDDNKPKAFIDAFYSYSDDGGDTWTETPLTPAAFNSELDGRINNPPAFIGDYLGLAVGGNFAYPCYLSNQNGDSDIFVHAIVGDLPGDLNCDGVVDAGDVAPFVQALVDPAGYQAAFPDCDINRADMDGDTAISGADIQPFVGILVP